MGGEMLAFVVLLVLVGLVGGFVARWIVPGPDPISSARTVAIGLIGSVVGGFLGYWLFGAELDLVRVWVTGVLGAITGAVLLLMLDNYVTGRKNQITLGPPR